MNFECEAPPCTATDDDNFDEGIEGRNIEMDFGTVEIFKEKTNYITFFRPMTGEDISFTIERNNSVKIIKSHFQMDHYKGVLKPNQDFNMPVTYKPTLPGANHIKTFDYNDSDGAYIKITLSGAAIGPHCTLSTKKLTFFKTPGKKFSEHKVEIENDSLCSTRFKIDHAHYDRFHIEPLEGVIKANNYTHISIRFSSETPGIFRRKIFFLIWNHEPLILSIIGICNETRDTSDSALKSFSNDPSFGFKAYLDDVVEARKSIRPFSITTNYLDFGSVLTNDNSESFRISNNILTPLIVNWETDKTSIFKIRPKRVQIPPESSFEFQVKFESDEKYTIFQETMIAQLDWDMNLNKKMSTANPMNTSLTCTLRIQGHSFPDNEGWIAHVEVLPEAIYFQPCVPGDTASTTFLMRNKSHLPAMFKLIAPKKTNIVVKPMMGKFRNVEIVAAQLQTEPLKVKTYIEEWKIIINGREDRQIKIYFHGETCVPIIEIGKKNKINAGFIQDGSQKEVQVAMKNHCFYDICYQFQVKNETALSVSPMTGRLEGNKSTKLIIVLVGSKCATKKESFLCEMRIIDESGAVCGDGYDTEVDVFYETAYSELCACPNSKNFGRKPFGHRVKVAFEVMNFGETTIYFQTCQSGDTEDKNFRIKPCFGEVKPKDCKHFSINGIISQVGNQTLHFGYYNRIVKDSPLISGDPITLFKLSYVGAFSIIQVDDIVEHNFGHLFGKYHLSKYYLDIPSLNKILRGTRNDEIMKVHMRFPDFQLQEKEFYIVLALTNITDLDTTVLIQRKKICECALEEMSSGISVRKKGFNCPHRNCLTMELQDTRFIGKATRFMRITMKYCLPGETQLCYLLKMSNNRVLEIYFSIYTIPPETPRLSYYQRDFALMLADVYLGIKVAPVQLYWMYNNTSHLLNVYFDTTELERTCRIERFKILEILNPVEQIMPNQCKALLVKFLPIEPTNYFFKVRVDYCFPEKDKIRTTFLIQGDGIMAVQKRRETDESIASVPSFSSDFPVTLSLEYININVLPVWSRRKELVFLKNNSRGKIVQYIWRTIKLDDLIEISTETTYGILRPKEIQPVLITIKSFSEPCTGTFLLPCEVVCYSDKFVYDMAKEKHAIAEARINEFMNGEPSFAKRPINPIIIPPEPEIFFTSISINITTIHTKDLDNYLDPLLQLKQYPNQSMENIPKSILKKYYPEKYQTYPEKEKIPATINQSQKMIFCRVMEDIISNVISSSVVKELLEQYTEAPLHTYQDFVMDDKSIMEKKMVKTPLSNQDIARCRRHEIEKFFNQLKSTELSSILQTLIYESVLKIAQCDKPSFDIDSLNKEIETALYVCRKKNCTCNETND